MRHTAATVLTAALLLAATACGSSDSGGDGDGADGSGKDTAAAGTPSPSTSAEREGQYIYDSQDIPFTTRRPSNEELLVYPPKWCAALDAGHSVKWMFSLTAGNLYPVGQDWGTVKDNAYRLLLLGVRVYCPQHSDAVTSELRASGEY